MLFYQFFSIYILVTLLAEIILNKIQKTKYLNNNNFRRVKERFIQAKLNLTVNKLFEVIELIEVLIENW